MRHMRIITISAIHVDILGGQKAEINMDLERQLVTIRTVSEVVPIEGADKIELCKIDGWQCVVKKGEFQVGDVGLYFEIDSFIPLTPEPSESPFEFLRKDARNWNGMFGTRIKTIKLRGQISQGLLLSSKSIPSPLPLKRGEYLDNLAKHFGVVKWEREVPQQEMRQDHWFDAVIRFFVPKKYRPVVFDFIYSRWLKRKNNRGVSSFPSFIPKTDEDRIQNKLKYLVGNEDLWEITTKMNGSSMTIYVKDGKFGHCSRNVKLGLEDGSNFSKVVKKYEMQTKLPEILGSTNLAVQGEMCGPGVQGNYEQLEDHDFFVFRIFNIDEQRYLSPDEMAATLEDFARSGLLLKRVPVLGKLPLWSFADINAYLEYAEGPGLNCKQREGCVFQRWDGKDSFKVIANSYLLAGGD